MNNRHHFLLPAEHFVGTTNRVTRTEDFIPIWTYKKKGKWSKVSWTIAGVLCAASAYLYFFQGVQ